MIEAPVVEIRAPIAGRFVSALAPGERVREGASLGTVQGFDGAQVPLESPCDCRVLDQLALSGLYHQTGEPLVALIPAAAPLLVRAQLPLEQAERLGIGDRAEIHVPERGEPLPGQIARLDFRPGRQAIRDRSEPTSRHLAQVLVCPDQPFAFQGFGVLVSIRFP